jgi:O-6-methylguanine DNA methyltransferase
MHHPQKQALLLNDSLHYSRLSTPIGSVLCACSSTGIALLQFADTFADEQINSLSFEEPASGLSLFMEIRSQLDAYFSASLFRFDLPLDLNGSDFQQQVWKLLRGIPYGTTITYGQLANELGSSSLTRAVARAIATNPLLLLIPCHRVVGAGNKLTGYLGGVERKRWLIQHEKQHTNSKKDGSLF